MASRGLGDADLRGLLARNVLAARKEANLSQSQVAAKATIHNTEISRIERGLRDPRMSTIVRLARALRVPPGSLIESGPQPPPPPVVPLATATLLHSPRSGLRAADDTPSAT